MNLDKLDESHFPLLHKKNKNSHFRYFLRFIEKRPVLIAVNPYSSSESRSTMYITACPLAIKFFLLRERKKHEERKKDIKKEI